MSQGIVPIPSVPRWFPAVAACLWIGLVAAAAVVADKHGFAADFGGLLLGTAATVAFAAAGGGALVARWQDREWERRTRFIVGTLITETLDQLMRLAVTTYDILVQPLPATQQRHVHDLAPAFRVPLGDMQTAALRGADSFSMSMMSALFSLSKEASMRSAEAKEVFTSALRAYDAARKELVGEMLAGPAGSDDEPDTRQGDVVQDVAVLAPAGGSQASAQKPIATAIDWQAEPPSITVDLDYASGVVGKQATTATELDAAAQRLHELIVELSGYVPSQARDLLTEAISLRQQFASMRIDPEPEPETRAQAEAPRLPPSAQRLRHPDAEAALEAAKDVYDRTLEEQHAAAEAASLADRAFFISSHARSILVRVADLLRALDRAYRERYRDPSRGLEAFAVRYGEAAKLEADRWDMITAAAGDFVAAASDFHAAISDPPGAEKSQNTSADERPHPAK